MSSIYSPLLNEWIYSNCYGIFKIVNNIVSKLLLNIDEAYNLYIDKHILYIIQSHGYIIFNMKTQETYIIHNDKINIGFSQKFGIIYSKNNYYVQSFSIVDNNVYECNIIDDDYFVLTLSNTKFSIKDNYLIYDDNCIKIHESVLGECRMYKIEIINEEFLIISICNDFPKNWYIKYDIITKTFSSWMYLKTICYICMLNTNKILVAYPEQIYILSLKDFNSLFENKSLKMLNFEIEKGSSSMIYHKDKDSLFSLDNHEQYIYYVYNNILMATEISPPYKMYIIAYLEHRIIHINVQFHEVFVQYVNNETAIIKI